MQMGPRQLLYQNLSVIILSRRITRTIGCRASRRTQTAFYFHPSYSSSVFAEFVRGSACTRPTTCGQFAAHFCLLPKGDQPPRSHDLYLCHLTRAGKTIAIHQHFGYLSILSARLRGMPFASADE